MHGVEQTVRVKVPSTTYGDELLRLKCLPDLLAYEKLFPNFKEITESFAAFRAIEKFLRYNYPLNDKNITAVVVGDGSTPRTGVTLAFRTKWRVISIDPNLRDIDKYKGVQRLSCYQGKVEDPPKDISFEGDNPVVLVHVHSHATIEQSLACIKTSSKLAVIAMPCCVPQLIPGKDPDFEYEDWGIWSPKRTMKIWRNVNE